MTELTSKGEERRTVTVERTRLSAGNQVVVPSEIRRRFGLRPGDEVIWTLLGDELHIRFVRKRKNSLQGLIGKLDMGPTDPGMIDDVVSSG